MRVDHLRVKNFKGFVEREFEFPRSAAGSGSFHLIVGQNGEGKTSLLDALAVAAGAWLLGIREYDSRHIREEDIRVAVQVFGDTEREEKYLPVEVEASGLVLGQELSWKRSIVSRKTTSKDAKKIKALAEQAVELSLAGKVATLPLISYYGAGRLWQEPNAPRAGEYASRLAGYRFSVDSRCNPSDLLAWLRFEQRLADHRRQESTQFRIVKDAIRRSVEGCDRIAFDPRLGLLLDIHGRRQAFRYLSDGQRNMVAMIGDLAFKAAQLNPHLGERVLAETPGIVLIDELDLHLHPRWQHHVVEDLRTMFPQIQFVATTHSPCIIQSMRSGEELIVLDGDAMSKAEPKIAPKLALDLGAPSSSSALDAEDEEPSWSSALPGQESSFLHCRPIEREFLSEVVLEAP